MTPAVIVAVAACAACADPRAATPEPCSASGSDCTVRVHEHGILDRASDAFHGKLLARHNWEFPLCQGCHGDDFAGGKAGVSCLRCHRDGPTTCETCHGDGGLEPVTTGAHPPHLAAMLACSECHVMPSSWDAPGHIVDDAPPAEVTFGARAGATPSGAERGGPPAWDGETCTNVYCHGDVTPRFAGVATRPRWADVTPAFTCDRCHGAPPPDHLRVDCTSCHPFTTSEHINGVVDIF